MNEAQGAPRTARKSPRWSVLAVTLAAVVASAASLRNGFALDDVLLIETDALVHSLEAPWRLLTAAYWRLPPADTLWRPFGLLSFAIQWVAGGGAPFVFHAVSVLLYVGVALLALALLREIFPARAALASALVFAVHPVHVESVGNIVGQLELAVAASLLGALVLYLRARRRGVLTLGTGVLIAMLFVLGLGFKEHALLLPGFLLLAELTLLRDALPPTRGWAHIRILFMVLLGLAVAWLLVRSGILGGDFAGDRPHRSLRGLSLGERSWVMLGILPEITRLLLWPARLYADYSPQFIRVLPTPAPWHLVGASILAAWGGALAWAWRRDRAMAFGLLWTPLALSLVANIVVPTGVLLAERTLFLASLGPVIAGGALFVRLAPRIGRSAWWSSSSARTASVAAGVALLGVVAAHSSARQLAWRDNTTLLTTLIVEAPENFRGHFWLGDSLLRAGELREGERAMMRAMALWPEHDGAPLGLAIYYQKNGLCGAALPLYRRVITLEPEKATPRFGEAGCLLSSGHFTEARAAALRAIAIGTRATRAFNVVILEADSALAASDSILPNNRWVLHEARRRIAGSR